jgi:hypothetical protein
MKQQPDPLELLEAARPSDGRVDLSSDPIASAILQRTLDDPSDGRVARLTGRRTRLAVIVSVVGVVAVAGTAAAITLRHDKPSEVRTIGCWSGAVVPTPEIVVVEWSDESPVQSCQQAWRNGQFETIPATEPPPLVHCISSDGAIAVVPGDEATCEELDLASFDPTPDLEGEKVRSAIAAIETRITPEACLAPTAAISVVEEILDDAGLTEWTIVPPTDTFPEGEPCASAGFDLPTMTVYIVPLARAAGG